jgi:hypothetical protein
LTLPPVGHSGGCFRRKIGNDHHAAAPLNLQPSWMPMRGAEHPDGREMAAEPWFGAPPARCARDDESGARREQNEPSREARRWRSVAETGERRGGSALTGGGFERIGS